GGGGGLRALPGRAPARSSATRSPRSAARRSAPDWRTSPPDRLAPDPLSPTGAARITARPRPVSGGRPRRLPGSPQTLCPQPGRPEQRRGPDEYPEAAMRVALTFDYLCPFARIASE